ncbi:hypothetical protein DMH02_018980 [Streptomyces sp. WAC 00631]|uniref:SCO4983 family protein n=1 Tax=Streptomyces sp. WAC 00631 TaxID=2203201 RepID=UPI000F769C70|nr:hypothetical protein [Streptomyces sp. WAC 00631]MCC5035241.1 hypothetical protein [Streptomyces sp. WAC 00631]
MYEPIRSKSVHAMGEPTPLPRRPRQEELDIQLAGHLAALLTVTDELRALAPDPSLDRAAQRLTERVTRLRDGSRPARSAAAPAQERPDADRVASLHRRAHTLAGRALVVAASRADTGAAILSAERMDAHAAALDGAGSALSGAAH